MARKHQEPRHVNRRDPSANSEPSELRIVGGSLGGRKILTTGQARTRPMKDRVREAVFNLVGPGVKDKHALDLFAGSGALGIEAISRGAAGATLIEHHLPTSELVRRNVEKLGLAGMTTIVWADTFLWVERQAPPTEPWVVFCSPPYAFYADRQADMLKLIGTLVERALPGSILVVEFDERFDQRLLPGDREWLVREYPPATVAIYRK